MPKAWIGLGVMAICFGAANAIRSAIRHNPKGAQPSSPLIPTTPTPRASATAATKSPAEGSPLVGVEVGSRPAGQEIDGRLMITDVEMKAIVHQVQCILQYIPLPNSRSECWLRSFLHSNGLVFSVEPPIGRVLQSRRHTDMECDARGPSAEQEPIGTKGAGDCRGPFCRWQTRNSSLRRNAQCLCLGGCLDERHRRKVQGERSRSQRDLGPPCQGVRDGLFTGSFSPLDTSMA